MTRYDDVYDITGAIVLINPSMDAEYFECVNARLSSSPEMECDEKEWWGLVTMANPLQRDPQAREFAERWARLMQLALLDGKSIAEVYEYTSREAALTYTTRGDVNRAVQFLKQCWVHGEELDRLYWHPGLTVDPKKLRYMWKAYWTACKLRSQANAFTHESLEDEVYQEALSVLEDFYAGVDPTRGIVILNEYLQASIQRDWADANFSNQVSLAKSPSFFKKWEDWARGVANWASKVAVAHHRFEHAQEGLDKLTMGVRVTE